MYPRSVADTQVEFGVCCTAFVDIVALLLTFTFLFVLTGGEFTGDDVTITYLHLIHVPLLAAGFAVYAAEQLYYGAFFLIGAGLALIADLVVTGFRFFALVSTPSLTGLILIFFDIVFVVTALMYVLWAIRGFTSDSWIEPLNRPGSETTSLAKLKRALRT